MGNDGIIYSLIIIHTESNFEMKISSTYYLHLHWVYPLLNVPVKISENCVYIIICTTV